MIIAYTTSIPDLIFILFSFMLLHVVDRGEPCQFITSYFALNIFMFRMNVESSRVQMVSYDQEKSVRLYY